MSSTLPPFAEPNPATTVSLEIDTSVPPAGAAGAAGSTSIAAGPVLCQPPAPFTNTLVTEPCATTVLVDAAMLVNFGAAADGAGDAARTASRSAEGGLATAAERDQNGFEPDVPDPGHTSRDSQPR
jgi:hypothetical protein